jgi:type II secretory pathway component PulK
MIVTCWTLRCRSEGYILIAVLCILVGAGAVGFHTSLVAREMVAATRNRADLIQAAWRAEDCLARTRALIHATLQTPPTHHDRVPEWAFLDLLEVREVRPRIGTCDVDLQPAGAKLDINAASAETLTGVFGVLGVTGAAADSLVDAILDWIDADDVQRPHGAERGWYQSRRRTGPRNANVADIKELHFVRGLEQFQGMKQLLHVEQGRVSLRHAPRGVLLSLRGLGDAAVARIMEARRTAGNVNLALVAGEITASAEAGLRQHYAELMATTTPDPDAWILTSRAGVGSPLITVVVQVRLVRAGERAAVVRRRTWTE